MQSAIMPRGAGGFEHELSRRGTSVVVKVASWYIRDERLVEYASYALCAWLVSGHERPVGHHFGLESRSSRTAAGQSSWSALVCTTLPRTRNPHDS